VHVLASSRTGARNAVFRGVPRPGATSQELPVHIGPTTMPKAEGLALVDESIAVQVAPPVTAAPAPVSTGAPPPVSAAVSPAAREVQPAAEVHVEAEAATAAVYHTAWSRYLFLVITAAVMAIVGWQTYTFDGTCLPIPCKVYGVGCSVVAALLGAVILPAACSARLEVDAGGFRQSDCCSTNSVLWSDVASVRVRKFRTRMNWPLCCVKWSREVITVDLIPARSKQKNEHGVDVMLEHFSFGMAVTAFAGKLNRMREAAASNARAEGQFRLASATTYEPPVLVTPTSQGESAGPPPVLGAYRAIGPLNVRTEPSVRAAKLRTLAAGDQVVLTQLFTDQGNNHWGQFGDNSWAMVSNATGVHFLERI
jgi:hypothetical protein